MKLTKAMVALTLTLLCLLYVFPVLAYDMEEQQRNYINFPSAGGIGTIVFTVGGLALMAVAIYAYKKSRDTNDKNKKDE